MKNYFLASLLIISVVVNAQNRKLDSLNALISKATSDTQRINLIVSKLGILYASDLDSTIFIANEALKDAQKINFYKGEFYLRSRLLNCYSFKGAYDKAREQYNYLLTFTRAVTDSSDFGELYANVGLFYGIQSAYDSSIYAYENAMRIYERIGNKRMLTGVYSNLAIGYQQQSNFSVALVYQQKGLQLAEENKDEVNQAYTLMNMGNTYSSLNDTLRAEQSILQAIEIAKLKFLKNVELYGYSNLGTMYTKQMKWQKVYEFCIKAAELGGSMGDQSIEASSYAKAATALAYLGKLAEAEAMAERAIKIADSSAQPIAINQSFSTMGGIQSLKGNYRKAIEAFEKSFSAINDSKLYNAEMAQNYKQLSDCYEKTGNYKKAIETHKIATDIKDSVFRKENLQKSTEVMMTYEFEKKEAVAKAEQDRKDAVEKRRKNQQLFAILVLGIIVLAIAVIAFIQFRNNKHKQKVNAALQQEKEKVEVTLTELKATQAQLIQSEKMASLGELASGIAHEIQNPLNFVNNFSELSNELMDEMSDELVKGNYKEVSAIAGDIKENLQKINHHGKRADAIVKGMLQHSHHASGKKESTDVSVLIDEYLRLAYNGMKRKDNSFDVDLKTDLDPLIENIDLVPQDVGRVLHNLFTNAFYAVHEKLKTDTESGRKGYRPEVAVSVVKKGSRVEIKVKDNGGGIDPKFINKIFQPFFTTKPAGQGTGLGLSLAYDIVKAHGGEISVQANEGAGTTFIIQLPVS